MGPGRGICERQWLTKIAKEAVTVDTVLSAMMKNAYSRHLRATERDSQRSASCLRKKGRGVDVLQHLVDMGMVLWPQEEASEVSLSTACLYK